MIFFTSDTHFGHKLLADGSLRPFTSVDEMDAVLIYNWNSVVDEHDTVYHLGDVSMCGIDKTAQVMDRLNGHKILIRGNHDERSPTCYERCGFSGVLESAYIDIDGARRFLIHDPAEAYIWEKVVIHGHIHPPRAQERVEIHEQTYLNKTRMPIEEMRINVCTDLWNFTPASATQITAILRKYGK